MDSQAFDYGGSAQLRRAIGSELLSTAGIDLFGRAGVDASEKQRVPDQPEKTFDSLENGRQNDLGAYTTLQYSPGPFLLQGGLRYSHHWQSSVDASDEAGGAWSVSGGLLVPIGILAPRLEGLELVTNVGTGVRFPSLTERFFSGTTGRGGVIGNPLLKRERSLDFDVGLRCFRDRLLVELFAFRNRVNDYIEQVDVAPDLSTFRNTSAGVIRGIELDGSYRLSSDSNLRLEGHVLDGRDDAGNHLADIPPARVSIEAETRAAKILLAVRLERRFSKGDPGPGEVDLGASTLLSLRAGIALDRGFTIWLYGSSLTDKSYRASADEKSALSAGRSFGIGVRWGSPELAARRGTRDGSEGSMKRRGDTTPIPRGGRAAARQRLFNEQRGRESDSPLGESNAASRAKKRSKKTTRSSTRGARC